MSPTMSLTVYLNTVSDYPVTEGKMKEMKHKSHKSQFKFEYEI